uniref:Zf-RING_UBOX domain-containing protein n=1 Tax=Globodera pallida TaxID=36090 RepID=A0A183BIF2_GLOPA
MTKSIRSPLHQLVDRPSSSSQSSSPTPNERASSNVENGQIRASFDGSANFDLKLQQNPNAFSSPALSLFPSSKFPLDANRQIMPICAQCSQAIVDPFILRVHPDLEFHSDCLKSGRATSVPSNMPIRRAKGFGGGGEDPTPPGCRRCPENVGWKLGV